MNSTTWLIKWLRYGNNRTLVECVKIVSYLEVVIMKKNDFAFIDRAHTDTHTHVERGEDKH